MQTVFTLVVLGLIVAACLFPLRAGIIIITLDHAAYERVFKHAVRFLRYVTGDWKFGRWMSVPAALVYASDNVLVSLAETGTVTPDTAALTVVWAMVALWYRKAWFLPVLDELTQIETGDTVQISVRVVKFFVHRGWFMAMTILTAVAAGSVAGSLIRTACNLFTMTILYSVLSRPGRTLPGDIRDKARQLQERAQPAPALTPATVPS
jgi:hypothetical protein